MVLKAGRRGLPRVVRVEFWELVGAGVPWTVAGARCRGGEGGEERWFRLMSGGAEPNGTCRVGGRYLGVAEREEIAVGLAAGEPLRVIAARIGRSPSTICREVARNRTTKGVYRAVSAQAAAEDRARRPKTAKLAADPVLRELVQDWLERKRSPRQIAARLGGRVPS